MPCPRDHFMDRRHADDLPRRPGHLGPDAAANHLAGGLPGAQEHARQVDGQHGVPLLERHLREGRVALKTGVVDEDVDAVPGFEHLPEHVADLILPRHVRPDGEGIAAALLDLVHYLAGVLKIAGVVDHDVGPRCTQRLRNAAPETRAGPGHECLLPLRWLVKHGPARLPSTPRTPPSSLAGLDTGLRLRDSPDPVTLRSYDS